jgi:hypothetical protein
MTWDRYGSDVLANDPHARRLTASRTVPATPGLVVEDVDTGWVGAVIRVEKSGGMNVVVLGDRVGNLRSFRLGKGFWVDGQPVNLVAPVGPGPVKPSRTASGSRAVHGAKARVARASRIWVEGKHDAELVAKVWGEDLALEGVVVEMLDGADNLVDRVTEFAPTSQARLGVLLDHLVEGSKEWRIAQRVVDMVPPGTVKVLGHPYIDVWQAVKPARLGLAAWPKVARGQEWKRGVLAQLGWDSTSDRAVAAAWRRILALVRDYRDLEPALLGRMEELIDFATVPTTPLAGWPAPASHRPSR